MGHIDAGLRLISCYFLEMRLKMRLLLMHITEPPVRYLTIPLTFDYISYLIYTDLHI